tara:strand:- start:10 stop:219 length:210 start_codon:yes stop_codon:yes gene_type:complete
MKEIKVRQPIKQIDQESITLSIITLKDMIKWSDRLGSDEINEIEMVLDLLEKNGVSNKVAIKRMMSNRK